MRELSTRLRYRSTGCSKLAMLPLLLFLNGSQQRIPELFAGGERICRAKNPPLKSPSQFRTLRTSVTLLSQRGVAQLMRVARVRAIRLTEKTRKTYLETRKTFYGNLKTSRRGPSKRSRTLIETHLIRHSWPTFSSSSSATARLITRLSVSLDASAAVFRLAVRHCIGSVIKRKKISARLNPDRLLFSVSIDTSADDAYSTVRSAPSFLPGLVRIKTT